MSRFWAFVQARRKPIIGAALAGLAGILTVTLGADNIWVAVVIPVVAVALGVNYTPNRHPEPEPQMPVQNIRPVP